MKWDYRPNYILHLAAIVLTLFPAYYLGNQLLNFSIGNTNIKMFLWFLLIFYLADNIWEAIFKV